MSSGAFPGLQRRGAVVCRGVRCQTGKAEVCVCESLVLPGVSPPQASVSRRGRRMGGESSPAFLRDHC